MQKHLPPVTAQPLGCIQCRQLTVVSMSLIEDDIKATVWGDQRESVMSLICIQQHSS